MSDISPSNMFVDTEDFDFEHGIIDDTSDYEEPVYEEPETEEEYDDIDDAEDLTGNLDDDDRQFNPHNGVTPEEYLSTLDDDATIDFQGVPITKRELNEVIQDREFIKANKSFYEQQDAFAFNQYNEYIASVLNESTSETDRSIQWLQQSIQAAINSDDYEEIGRLTKELNKYQARKSQLDERNEEIKQMRDVQQAQITAAKIQETDTAMLRKYGQRWATEGSDVYVWAVQKGIPFESLKGALCPALADLLMSQRDAEIAFNSKKQQNINVVKNKIQATRSPTPRKTTNRSAQTNANQVKRSKLTSKMGNGGLTQDELGSMFDHLVD